MPAASNGRRLSAVTRSVSWHELQTALEVLRQQISPGTLDRLSTAAAQDRVLQCAERAPSPSQRSHCTASTVAAAHQEHPQTCENIKSHKHSDKWLIVQKSDCGFPDFSRTKLLLFPQFSRHFFNFIWTRKLKIYCTE